MKLITVEEDKTLSRDVASGAILSTDKESLAIYRQQKAKRNIENTRLINLENEVLELKILLNSLLNGKG